MTKSNFSFLKVSHSFKFPFCSRVPGNKWAFEQAKQNLVDKYLLVGLTEQMQEFVAVLEATLPSLFKGALKLYRKGTTLMRSR